ncbi:MAG: response regulator [Sulfuricaulis sp.]|nr:response regulator [Sulfuricaulis sp.]
MNIGTALTDESVQYPQADIAHAAVAPRLTIGHDPIGILIVDDEPKNLATLATILDDPDYQLVRAESADQALLALAVEEFALCILDVRMPDPARIPTQPGKAARVPVIFITACYNEEQQVLTGYGSSAVDYLHRPVNPAILRAKVAVFAELHRKYCECAAINRALRAEVIERRRAEQKLRELNETLDRRIAGRIQAQAETTGRYHSPNDISQNKIPSLIANDIAERNPAEYARREPTVDYRDLLNLIDEGFCVIEMIFDECEKPVDYRFLEVNSSFEKQTGLHDVVERRMRDIAPDHEAHWFEIYGNVALTGKPVRFLNNAKALDGRWFDVYAFRFGERGSRKVAILFTDITERKNFESTLKEAAAIAEKANLAKSEFLSSMSHELRAPLHAILGFAQLIERGSPAPTVAQKRATEQILRAGWYLLDLINEMLDLAAVESGKLQISMAPIPLTEVLRECEAMIEPQAQARGVHVTFHKLDIPHFVQADRTRVKQVLINLLSNAVKYSKPGGAVDVDCTAASPGRIRVCVRDCGGGLAPEKIAQLFQPFNRLGQDAGAEKGTGTGIGLVVSKRFVELMGGSMGMESTVGVGSMFWIELNLATTPEPVDAAAPTAIAPAPVQASAALRSLLYVEDNPANLMLVEDLIARRPDIRLLSATDGIRGVEIARASRPDVILMDIGLPGLGGIEVLKSLAQDPATAHIPVVALSANAMYSEIENGLAAGFFRYLTKPIKLDELMDTLNLALESSPTAFRPLE